MAAIKSDGAAAPGLAAPEWLKSDDARERDGGAGIDGQGAVDDRDCAKFCDNGKRFAELRARLAMLGFALHRAAADDGSGYFVARWGASRELRDLEDAAQFLAQVGGDHA